MFYTQRVCQNMYGVAVKEMNTGRSMALYRKLVGQINAYESRLLARYGRYI